MMKRSNFFMPSRREITIDPTSKSSSYMEKMGMVSQVGAGMYSHLPAAFKLFGNVKKVLNKHLADAGCSEHQFPAIQPVSLWKGHGRFEMFGPSIFSFKDRHGKETCLAPTHEVLAAETAKKYIRSYRDLPVRISQIQTKYRDEARPRAGVMKTREFTMHDAYSFDADQIAAEQGYELIKLAYVRALTEMRVPFAVKQQDDMGDIGGLLSHEFHVSAPAGEDCFVDPISGETHSSIEIAHIFMLGDKYSASANAFFTDKDGAKKLVFMCSFGMGIERTAAAFIENYLDNTEGLTWSWSLAPFKTLVLGDVPEAMSLYHELNAAGHETMIDDRSDDHSFNQKLKEGMLMGCPLYVILGKRFESEEKVEIRAPGLNCVEYVDVEEVVEVVNHLKRQIESVELARMTFRILNIDRARKRVFAEVQNVRQLDGNFCDRMEQCSDLLGNFDRKNLSSNIHLKSGDFWVVPIMNGASSECEIAFHNGVPYVRVCDIEKCDFVDVGRFFDQAC